MEIVTVNYTSASGSPQKHHGSFLVVNGGLVIRHSENSQIFVPFHRVDGIVQTFTEDTERSEKLDKSLYNRMRVK